MKLSTFGFLSLSLLIGLNQAEAAYRSPWGCRSRVIGKQPQVIKILKKHLIVDDSKASQLILSAIEGLDTESKESFELFVNSDESIIKMQNEIQDWTFPQERRMSGPTKPNLKQARRIILLSRSLGLTTNQLRTEMNKLVGKNLGTRWVTMEDSILLLRSAKFIELPELLKKLRKILDWRFIAPYRQHGGPMILGMEEGLGVAQISAASGVDLKSMKGLIRKALEAESKLQ